MKVDWIKVFPYDPNPEEPVRSAPKEDKKDEVIAVSVISAIFVALIIVMGCYYWVALSERNTKVKQMKKVDKPKLAL